MREVYNVDIDSSERNTTLYPSSNNYTIELNRPMYDVSKMTIVSGIVVPKNNTFDGLMSLIILVSCGSDKFYREVCARPETDGKQMLYTGRILLGIPPPSNEGMVRICDDDPIVHRFRRCPKKCIDKLHIEFFYNNGTELLPYDFGSKDHILKFEFECRIDKLESQSVSDLEPMSQLPPPVDYIYDTDDTRFNLKQKTIILVVLVFLIAGLLALSGQSSIRAEPV